MVIPSACFPWPKVYQNSLFFPHVILCHGKILLYVTPCSLFTCVVQNTEVPMVTIELCVCDSAG